MCELPANPIDLPVPKTTSNKYFQTYLVSNVQKKAELTALTLNCSQGTKIGKEGTNCCFVSWFLAVVVFLNSFLQNVFCMSRHLCCSKGKLIS